MKVLTVVGARPQFIKAYAVSRELRRDHEEVLVHTGQHYDTEMSEVFFETLGIAEPDYNLAVGSATHGVQTGEMLAGIEELVETEAPDVVLLYGDTNSTIAGALAAAKMDPEVAHVEAGLRSFNRDMPEETNRVLTDHAADFLFVPSEKAVQNLRNEGLTDRIYLVGDVMYDAILSVRGVASEESTAFINLGIKEGEYILSTVHRANNTDDPERLEAILTALATTDKPVVLPLHPRTKNRLDAEGLLEFADRELILIDPLGYLDFVRLLDAADRVATDSGGVQKEAFFLDTYCVTMRDETEWVETIEAGWNTLVGADRDAIVSALETDWTKPAEKPAPYGDGTAASQIVSVLAENIQDE